MVELVIMPLSEINKIQLPKLRLEKLLYVVGLVIRKTRTGSYLLFKKAYLLIVPIT